MIVRQLIEELEKLPQDMEVFIHQQNDEFNLSLVDAVEQSLAHFTEGTDSELNATDTVVVIRD